ncbi:PriCT-2 domain-containing protein [Cronobacter sakazakii]|nr:PriCT-2 domain-containing protein [Cronobacter sakazakii]EJG0745151.1 PriCT-2 domain-containing protein [Cronobacter sakazakii]ELY2534412.1 PriCT-2 domain-containing protein [Cronobacter sakazakii]ELY2538286.1 PriCT-2 domain-containing protein [Cronobacter sakazakii]ELY4821165.1 PriCT-2 domain-containing protein [Cronobacter sakazakii]
MSNLASGDGFVNKSGYVVISDVSGQIVPDFHSFKYESAQAYIKLLPGHSVKTWMEAHVEELTGKGYRLIPHGPFGRDGADSYLPYGRGQSYSAADASWSVADYIGVPVPQDCIMIDWDGDKPNAATVEDVATALGLTVKELDRARIQCRRKGDKPSVHWLFRLPENTPVKTCANEWLSRVDIRANTDHVLGSKNGIIDIKPGKIINLPHVDKIVKLDVSCVAVPFPKHDDNVDRTKIPMPTGANVEEVRDALTFIDPDCEHDDWKDIGMALQSEFGDSGLSLWDEWSSKGAKYPGTRELRSKYRTFKPKAGGVTIRTLFKMARDSGWNSRKVIDAAMVFAAPTLPTASTDPKPVVREGFQWIPAQQLAEFFAGCIYIASEHAVLMPNGSRLKPEAFNAIKGGYIFGMDAEGDKSTDKAFDAFTRNRCVTLPKVINTHFAPDKPFGSVEMVGGVDSVNTYLPCPGVRKAGDVTPFLQHIEKLLPVEADRDILLNWMAYKVQHPGECMRWAPVLVGAPGNGKTTVADVMRYAIGDKYVSVVQSSDVDNKFNGWAYEKCLAVINDFKVGDKRDVMEVLKPMITDKRIPVQKKGTDTVTSSNHLGFIITSNHRDAVVKTSDDRRYAVFFTAQNNESDIMRDGMDDGYFVQLNDWLDSNGYSAVAEYLSQRHVARHPNRAPETSSMSEAIRESMTPTQSAILEAVEDGRPGFCNNIIVAAAAKWVLENNVVKITHAKLVGRVLRELGYEPIPNSESWKINGNRFSPWAKRGTIPANTTLSKEEVVRLSGYIDNRALAMAQQ